MSRRTERVNALIREELSELIAREVKDPRITGIISILKVDVSPDLSHSRIHISTLGDDLYSGSDRIPIAPLADQPQREMMRATGQPIAQEPSTWRAPMAARRISDGERLAGRARPVAGRFGGRLFCGGQG